MSGRGGGGGGETQRLLGGGGDGRRRGQVCGVGVFFVLPCLE